MVNRGLDYLIGKTIQGIYKIIVNEGCVEYEPNDTFVLKTLNNELLQLVIDYSINVYSIPTVNDAIVLGEYDRKILLFKLKLETELKNDVIETIIDYYKGENYHFGSKFLNFSGQFMFGFCFGFDEVILLKEKEFYLMLNSYNLFETKRRLI
jgi:hypothetical protein